LKENDFAQLKEKVSTSIFPCFSKNPYELIITITTLTNKMDDSKSEGKSVRFYGRVKFRRVKTPETKEEIDKCWYSFDEMATARKTERQLRAYISDDKDLNEENFAKLSALGIRTEDEKLVRLRAIRESIDAVLEEQEKQESEFIDETNDDNDALFFLDFDKVSEVYTEYSKPSAAEALQRGMLKAKHQKEHVLPQLSASSITQTPVKDITNMNEYPSKRITPQMRHSYVNAAA
jgi:hypothetical protein